MLSRWADLAGPAPYDRPVTGHRLGLRQRRSGGTGAAVGASIGRDINAVTGRDSTSGATAGDGAERDGRAIRTDGQLYQ